jgi:cytochrome c biogenesis protein CcdA
VLLLVASLGEFGLFPKLLPDYHLAVLQSRHARVPTTGPRWRQAAAIGLASAATVGIICPRPTYLGLLAVVVLLGSVPAGALLLTAYGAGQVGSIWLGTDVITRATRSDRVAAWVAANGDSIHLSQGIALAGLGAYIIASYAVR